MDPEYKFESFDEKTRLQCYARSKEEMNFLKRKLKQLDGLYTLEYTNFRGYGDVSCEGKVSGLEERTIIDIEGNLTLKEKGKNKIRVIEATSSGLVFDLGKDARFRVKFKVQK